jgi:hypothetical protein
MKNKNIFAILLFILSTQNACASDTTGLLVFISISGIVIGLFIGIIICFILSTKKKIRKTIWLTLPVYPIIGGMITFYLIMSLLHLNEDVIETSFGKYDPQRGGMGVIQVPHNFKKNKLEHFYATINDKTNLILFSHEYSVAIIKQFNGIRQVHLNVYPSIKNRDEYFKINNEIEKKMKIILNQKTKKTSVKNHDDEYFNKQLEDILNQKTKK